MGVCFLNEANFPRYVRYKIVIAVVTGDERRPPANTSRIGYCVTQILAKSEPVLAGSVDEGRETTDENRRFIVFSSGVGSSIFQFDPKRWAYAAVFSYDTTAIMNRTVSVDIISREAGSG